METERTAWPRRSPAEHRSQVGECALWQKAKRATTLCPITTDRSGRMITRLLLLDSPGTDLRMRPQKSSPACSTPAFSLTYIGFLSFSAVFHAALVKAPRYTLLRVLHKHGRRAPCF